MLVFSKARLVFLSVPKTGTTAYEAALRDKADLVLSGPPALKHASLHRYQRFIMPMYTTVLQSDMDVIAVIREPVSWLGSWYRYRTRAQLDGHANSTAHISFTEFVEACCAPKPPAFAQIGSQARFLQPARDKRGIDHLFSYEQPETLHRFLSDRLGGVPEIPTLNVSPDGDLALDSRVTNQMRKTYSGDFALYDSFTG